MVNYIVKVTGTNIFNSPFETQDSKAKTTNQSLSLPTLLASSSSSLSLKLANDGKLQTKASRKFNKTEFRQSKKFSNKETVRSGLIYFSLKNSCLCYSLPENPFLLDIHLNCSGKYYYLTVILSLNSFIKMCW